MSFEQKRFGLIVVGYQGVGKTFISRLFPEKYIDLESSTFFVDGKRDPEWYKVYVQQAIYFANKGYTVLISSHKAVRDYLTQREVEYVTVVPSAKIQSEWIKRLSLRYAATNLEKDYKALENAKQFYGEGVTDLMTSKHCIILSDTNYNLDSVLSQFIIYTEADKMFGKTTLFNYEKER